MRSRLLLLPSLLLGCAGATAPAAEPPPAPVSAPASATSVPPTTPSASGPAAPVAPAPSAPASVAASAVPPTITTADLEQELTALKKAGFTAAATVIAARVSQERPKMKLTSEEGARAASYARQDLPGRPAARALLALMPKTTVELLRGVRERAVSEADAEGIAAYLARMHASMKMGNPEPFDENCSHVMARHWHEIETYKYEGMSWERQKKIYAPKGVDDFRTAGHVQRFFEIESRAPYFQQLYKPAGGLP
jgi:hypothetical protein